MITAFFVFAAASVFVLVVANVAETVATARAFA